MPDEYKEKDDERVQQAIDAYFINDKNKQAAANALGNVDRSTLSRRVRFGLKNGYRPSWECQNDDTISFPYFPEEEVSAEEILDHMEQRFEKRWEHHQSLKWFPIKINTLLPIAVCVFGDPHLGSNGCNIPMLRRDVDLVSKAEGCYGINIGDTADNWGGRLIRLYAENDVSRKTEQQLARWFLKDSGIKWLVWLFGNHDEMHSEFSTYLKAINTTPLPMVDWRARFRLVFPNDRECRWDAAHNHKGHSMWNELHGQERAAYMDEDADIFVAGHHHTWATKRKEMPDGRIANLARVRGYKWIDSHAERAQFTNQQHGASILFVIRPLAESAIEFVRMFEDIKDGIEYLKIIRKNDAKKADV